MTVPLFLLMLGGLCVSLTAHAQNHCFDFSKHISEPLRPPVTQDQMGKLPQGWDWAATRGTVSKPIQVVIKGLLTHEATKSPRVNKMQINDLHDPRYLAKQEVHYEVDPFPFVSVKWVEIWAFDLTHGTPEHPDRIVISYEKTEGTSHIEHLCGSYTLQRLGDEKTDVSIYEEGKATGRHEKDVLQGIRGNIRAMEKLQ